MLIHIDRETGKCILPSPLSSYFIEVPDDFNIFKVVEEETGEEIQETNDIGEKIYFFRYPENIEEILEELAKKELNPEDEDFEERLAEEKAKFTIRPISDFEGVEIVAEEKTPIIYKEVNIVRNEQIAKQVQVGEETTLDEEGKEIKVPVYKTVYKDNFINDVMTIPVYFVENEPKMKKKVEKKYVSLTENPEYFTMEEVIRDKYKMFLIYDSEVDNLLVETFFDSDSISLLDKAHQGQGFIEIEPQGVVKLNSVTLDVPSQYFKLLEVSSTGNLDFYISNKKVADNSLTLSSPINSFSLRVENNTDKPIILYSVCIGY